MQTNLPADEDAAIDAYLAKHDFADLAEWARDREYLFCDCCGWVDHEDNRVDIRALLLAEILESVLRGPEPKIGSRIVTLEVPYRVGDEDPPELWNWTDLAGSVEAIRVVSSSATASEALAAAGIPVVEDISW